jgi:beta-glucanase (GH16 family)
VPRDTVMDRAVPDRSGPDRSGPDDLAWPSDEPAWPGEEALDSPWPDGSAPRGPGSGNNGSGNKRPGTPKSNGGPKGRGGSMHRALMVSGVLGVAVVFAIGLVALAVMRGSSNGSAAANVTKATVGTSPSATASASHKTTASPKAKTSAKAKAKAKPAATKTTVSPASALLTVPAGWKLTFDPSFAGSQLDTSTWATCYDWANASVGCTNNPTKEKEWYIPSQVNVGGGTLNLVAKQESTQGTSSSGAAQTYTCRSGMVTSKPGFNFTYGLIQISAKLPYGPGLWPALWLAATNDQWPPELDIMEHWYSEPQMKVYDHTVGKQYMGGAVPTPENLSAGFNTYSLLWTKDRVTWYLNGVQVFTTTSYVPQQAMYFIANVADDSTAAGACSGTMEIQSIKVYQP